jgi:enamine deaminase RidA (YjgF/YER057c/UK114 family)
MGFKTFDITKGVARPGWTTYPFFHRSGPMPWAAASVLELSKIDKLIYLSGQTGRDPETDREPMNWQEMRSGVGHCVPGGIKAQTTACWTRIRETLDGLGADLADIAVVNYFLVNGDDAFDMLETTYAFFREHAPDLHEHQRAGVLLKGIELDLPDMLIEIQCIAVIPKKDAKP